MTQNVTTRAQRSIKKKAKTARKELEISRRQGRVDNLEDIRTRASIKRHREMASREIQKAIEGGQAGLRQLKKETEIKRGWYCTSFVTFPLRYEHHLRLLHLNELCAQIQGRRFLTFSPTKPSANGELAKWISLPVKLSVYDEEEPTGPRRSERVRQQKLWKLVKAGTP